MRKNIPRQIFLSKSVYRQLYASVTAVANRREIGGTLIGYQHRGDHYIEAITVDSRNHTATNISFVLDGALHTKLAQEIIDSADPQWTLIGVWHSHICDTTRFSEQDRVSNRILSALFDGALSLLITRKENSSDIEIAGYYIAQNGTEYPQNIIIQ